MKTRFRKEVRWWAQLWFGLSERTTWRTWWWVPPHNAWCQVWNQRDFWFHPRMGTDSSLIITQEKGKGATKILYVGWPFKLWDRPHPTLWFYCLLDYHCRIYSMFPVFSCVEFTFHPIIIVIQKEWLKSWIHTVSSACRFVTSYMILYLSCYLYTYICGKYFL